MKKIKFYFLVLLITQLISSVALAQISFEKVINAPGALLIRTSELDGNGGFIIGGERDDERLLIKLDQQGNTVWIKEYSKPLGEYLTWISRASENGYIIAGSEINGTTDANLIRINEVGDTLWTRKFQGNGYEVFYHVSVCLDSGFISVGETSSFSAGNIQQLIIKWDKNGNVEWSKTYDSPGLVGNQGRRVFQLENGDYIVLGTVESSISGLNDFCLSKLTDTGDLIWAKCFGESNEEAGLDLKILANGNYAVTGHSKSFSHGQEDVFLSVVDSLGNQLWSKTYGTDQEEVSYAINQTSDKGFLISGHTLGLGQGGHDWLIIRTDSLGVVLWVKTMGGNCTDHIWDVKKLQNDEFFVAGFSCSFQVGLGYEMYVVKTNSVFGNLCNISTETISDSSFTFSERDPNLIVVSRNIVPESAPFSINIPSFDSLNICNYECSLEVEIEFNQGAGIECANSLSATVGGGTPAYTYQWNEAANFQTVQTIEDICPGTYCVSVWDENGCFAESCLTILAVGYLIQSDLNFLIYPNPSTGIYNIDLGRTIESAQLNIYSIDGRKVFEQTFYKQQIIDIQLNNPPGVYIAHLNTEGHDTQFKLTIKQ